MFHRDNAIHLLFRRAYSISYTNVVRASVHECSLAVDYFNSQNKCLLKDTRAQSLAERYLSKNLQPILVELDWVNQCENLFVGVTRHLGEKQWITCVWAAGRQRCDASLHKGKKITIFTESMLSHNSCRLAYDFYHFVFVQWPWK